VPAAVGVAAGVHLQEAEAVLSDVQAAAELTGAQIILSTIQEAHLQVLILRPLGSANQSSTLVAAVIVENESEPWSEPLNAMLNDKWKGNRTGEEVFPDGLASVLAIEVLVGFLVVEVEVQRVVLRRDTVITDVLNPSVMNPAASQHKLGAQVPTPTHTFLVHFHPLLRDEILGVLGALALIPALVTEKVVVVAAGCLIGFGIGFLVDRGEEMLPNFMF